MSLDSRVAYGLSSSVSGAAGPVVIAFSSSLARFSVLCSVLRLMPSNSVAGLVPVGVLQGDLDELLFGFRDREPWSQPAGRLGRRHRPRDVDKAG